jgi:hypothetical protein
MKSGLIAVLCAVLTLFSFSSQAAETNVVEAFACDFNTGKTMTDLDAVTSYYAAERSKIRSPALQKMVSRVWTPSLGSVSVDFVWFNSNLNYRGWGEMRKSFDESSVGAAIQAKFDAVALCSRSGLYAQEVLSNNLEQEPFTDDGSVTIESFRCELHDGKTIADSDAAIVAWKPVFEKAIAATGSSAFVGRRTPIISGSGFDLSYFVVWDDAAAYADGNETFRTNPASAKSDALFAAAHRCESTLFTSRTMVPAPN